MKLRTLLIKYIHAIYLILTKGNILDLLRISRIQASVKFSLKFEKVLRNYAAIKDLPRGLDYKPMITINKKNKFY